MILLLYDELCEDDQVYRETFPTKEAAVAFIVERQSRGPFFKVVGVYDARALTLRPVEIVKSYSLE